LSNVWAREGDSLIHARLVAGRGANARLEGVTIYQRENGTVRVFVDARLARQHADGWRLFDVRVYDTGMNVVHKHPTLDVLPGVEPTRFTLAKLNPSGQDFASLNPAIIDLDRAGR